MRGPLVVMINPKTLELVEMYSERSNFRLGFAGKPESCVGAAYTAELQDIGDYSYLRIHSPSPCRGRTDFQGVNSDYRGQGYGVLLYCGVAISVYKEHSDASGVFSKEGTRSGDADNLWEGLVAKGLAENVEGGEEYETDEIQHCESISDKEIRRRGRDWRIQDDEVCSTVTIETGDEEGGNFQTLDGADLVEKDFVLWVKGAKKEETPPPDLITRVKVHDRAAVEKVISFLRDRYDDPRLVHAFVDRPDVAEILGQQSLLGRSRPLQTLPPVSRRTRTLVELFSDFD